MAKGIIILKLDHAKGTKELRTSCCVVQRTLRRGWAKRHRSQAGSRGRIDRGGPPAQPHQREEPVTESIERRRGSAAPVRGRPFQPGNPGRRPGSKNRTTLVAEALLRAEEEELVRKAIEMAKAGDAQMLKFLLDRILPKDRSVEIDLPPMSRALDAVNVLETITEAVGAGRIAPSEAVALQGLVMARARIMSEAELMSRLEDVEQRQNKFQQDLQNLQKGRYGSQAGNANSEN
jgi:hypothetical protein